MLGKSKTELALYCAYIGAILLKETESEQEEGKTFSRKKIQPSESKPYLT